MYTRVCNTHAPIHTVQTYTHMSQSQNTVSNPLTPRTKGAQRVRFFDVPGCIKAIELEMVLATEGNRSRARGLGSLKFPLPCPSLQIDEVTCSVRGSSRRTTASVSSTRRCLRCFPTPAAIRPTTESHSKLLLFASGSWPGN